MAAGQTPRRIDNQRSQVCLVIMKTLVLLVAGIALLVSPLTLTWMRGNEQHHLQKRAWSHDNSHLTDITQDHIHPWMNNAWYRYVHDVTKAGNKDGECYICSHMPTTTQHATLHGKPMNMTQVKCAVSFASIGHQYSGIILNHCNPLAIGLRKGTCDKLFWINFTVTSKSASMHFPVFLDNPTKWNHNICYRQTNGTRALGTTTNCEGTVAHGDGAPVKNNCLSNGTYWVQGMAWLCGQRAYFVLPPGWTGTCAPIFISDHTFKITAETHARTSRAKREVAEVLPHDSIYGSDVPKNFKLWTTGQKVLHSLFPWVGTGKNMLRIETLDYRFGLFLNASVKINKAQNEENGVKHGDDLYQRLCNTASNGRCFGK